MFPLLFPALLISLLTPFQPQSAPPKPAFQGDFFGEMPRAFCVIQKVDAPGKRLTVKLDGSGKIVEVPIRDDTEIHFRDSWGELTDYFPDQHVMLFMYIDDDHNWTYPRAVQDDIHMTARHNWFARVTTINRDKRTYSTRREERNNQGQVTKTVEQEVAFAPDAKVWKGTAPTSIEGLKVGDEVIQQLVERDGQRVAVEIFDRKGDDAVRAAQEMRHKQDQDRLGLPAYVNDIDPISGLLMISIAWSGADRAKELKPGEVVTLVPADGGKRFAAAISSQETIDVRQRIQCVINARPASRLSIGQSLRLFMPGTGPARLTGRVGLPSTVRQP